MDNQEQRNLALRGAITRVVAFFDIFDFPVTAQEIWKFCDWQCGLDEVVNFLNESNDFLEQNAVFYFLPGRADLCDKRIEKIIIAQKKYQKAMHVTKLFRFIPWIKMIAISNVIGQDNVKEESDIDLFVITEPNRIWITRFVSVVMLKILGLRPKPNDVQDKICLSFFVSENNLNLKNLQIDNDVYFYFWLTNLLPIHNQNNIYKKLIQANDWLWEKMPNWSGNAEMNAWMLKKENSIFYRDIIDLFIGGLDANLKNYQLKIMSPILKELMNKDTRVVVNDGVLKLISNDRREYYRDLYIKKIKELNCL